MALHIERAEGDTQYRTASDYFSSLIHDRVLEHSGDLHCTQQLFHVGDPVSRVVSIWQQGEDPKPEEIHLVMVQRMLKTINRLHHCDGSPEAVEVAIRSLPHHLESPTSRTFFIEAYQTEKRPVQGERRSGIFLGVVDNDVEFLDADDLMFIRLEPGLFGLAVADKGSYLVRIEDPNDNSRPMVGNWA